MKSYTIKDGMTVIDPCVHCGESTAPGYGKWVNRLGWDDGWSCANCASFDCDICDEKITLDEEYRWNDSIFACHKECLTVDQALIYELWVELDGIYSSDHPEGWFAQVMKAINS